MNPVTEKKMSKLPSKIASKIPTHGSDRDSGTHSRSSSVSNITTASDIHSEMGDSCSEGTDFKIDEKVYVNGTKAGIIKFLGKTEFAPGVWAGVLLDEAVGKNDGSVAGVKYFSCEPLRGVFARPNKLTRTQGAGIGDSASIGLITPKSNRAIASSRTSLCSIASATTPRPCCSKLRIGERITVSSLGGEKSGTLRFIGETDFAKGEWAGIELDEPTGKNDGSVAGKRYFTCPMKCGLFAPLHKVSRAGGTTPSRPASVRGIPLRRSTSRDSLSSSVSNCSRTSRVKLGVTSLSSAQKPKTPDGGIMTTTKALQEALKEKDHHVEQLLKERELDRAEIVKVTTHFKEFEKLSSDWEMKLRQTETDKKVLEDKLVEVQSKLEDIQFQFEEEKILKTELETQLQQRSQTLKRIDEFISKDPGDTFLNIMEILAGVDTLSEVGDRHPPSAESEILQNKISQLETSLQNLSAEKEEINNQFKELQNISEDSLEKSKLKIEELQTSVQEKEDIISELKSEFNKNIEIVAQVAEDNKNLNEQILLQEKEAKGQADEVIKELGEKVKSLTEEINIKSSQISDNLASIQEKGDKIIALEQGAAVQSEMLSKLQQDLIDTNNVLKQKETDIEESINIANSLEQTIANLKSQAEDHSNEMLEKINSYEQEVKSKSEQISEFVRLLQEKESAMALLQQNFDAQYTAFTELQNEYKELVEISKKKDAELEAKIAEQKVMEEKIISLQSTSDSCILEKEQKMLDLVKEIEKLTNVVQSKEDVLTATETVLKDSQKHTEHLNETILQLEEKLKQAEDNCSAIQNITSIKTQTLQNELSSLELDKAQRLGNAEVEILDLKSSIEKKNLDLQESVKVIDEHKAQVQSLTQKIKENEEELSKFKSDFQGILEKNEELSKEKESLEKTIRDTEEEIQLLRSTIEQKNQEFQENAKVLLQHKAQVVSLTENCNTNLEELSVVKSDFSKAMEKNEILSKEKEILEKSIKEFEETIATSSQQIENLRKSLDKSETELNEKEAELSSLKEVLNSKEELNNQLTSKLQLAEQKVEMLNKDSSEHVMSLQNELSKLKEESTTTVTHLEQELDKIKTEKVKLIDTISEKEKILVESSEENVRLQSKIKEMELQFLEEKESLLEQHENLKTEITKLLDQKEAYQQKHQEELTKLQEEFNMKCSKQEEELHSLQSKYEKLLVDLSDKEKAFADMEITIETLQSDLKSKENELLSLSSEKTDLLENIAKLNISLEELESRNKANLDSSMLEHDTILKEKEQIIDDTQTKLSEQTDKLNSKLGELQGKESEINSLKNVIQEKESKSEELNKELEHNKCQIEQLKAENESKISLLHIQETSIKETAEKHNEQVQSLQEAHCKEISNLQALLLTKESEVNQNEIIVANLTKEIEDHKQKVQLLEGQIEAIEADKKRLIDDSSKAYSDVQNEMKELETNIAQLLEEKDIIIKEQSKVKEDKNALELLRDSLVQEKSALEAAVKDRETKIEALQSEENKTREDLAQQNCDLQQKLEVSEMELKSLSALKTELELQHGLCEKLQEEVVSKENKNKELKSQLEVLPALNAEKSKLQAQVEEVMKINQEKSEMISLLQAQNAALEEQLNYNQNSILQKEKDLVALKDQLSRTIDDKANSSNIQSAVKVLEEENTALKNKITLLELSKSEKVTSAISGTKELSPEDADDRESLLSQIDFLNSIIVDMKQKNELLSTELELQKTCWDNDTDMNLNATPKKAIPPRMFCDICDMFDLHETYDCPKQESFVEEELPHLRKAGTRQLEERPYCNNCEVFGHWTLDCTEEQEF